MLQHSPSGDMETVQHGKRKEHTLTISTPMRESCFLPTPWGNQGMQGHRTPGLGGNRGVWCPSVRTGAAHLLQPHCDAPGMGSSGLKLKGLSMKRPWMLRVALPRGFCTTRV